MANTRVLDESGGKAIAEQVKRVKGTAEEASSSASSAKLVAEQAKQGADDAKASVLEASAKAQTAKETAEAAAATAGEAKTTAEAAQDAADAAQSTADTAKANAATAQSAAEAAQTTADGASEAAKTAQSAAEAAQTAADTAQQTAEAAQAAASQASAAVEKAQTAATAAQGAADTAQSAADAAQSAVEKANAAIDEVKQTAADAKKAAESAQSTADTAKANAATAQSAAEDAQSTADTAKTNAATAQSAAEAAQETANTAQQKAEAAQSAAEGAQETADAAQTAASDAQSTAATAKANAATAQSAAEAAQSAADKAQSAAEEAQTTADTAKTNAATAQSTADTAKANAATAQSTADTAKANAATAQSAAEAAQKTATDAKTAEEKHESNGDVHITAEEREKWNAAYEEAVPTEYGVRFSLKASDPAGERVKRQGGEIQTWDIEYTPNVGSVTENPFEAIKLFNPELFTDSAGNVFRSFSRFYVAIERTSEYLYYWVCEKQANDKYHLPRAFYKNGSPYWNHVDIGVYEGGQETQSDATCLNSKSGQTLWTNQTRTAAYEGAKAWHKHLSVDTSRECYMITQLSEITEILQPLLLIMFGTRHSQSVYNGVVSASNYVQTGQTDSISALCGTTSNGGTASFKALGIENIWGNVFKRVLDLTMKARTPWICENLDEWTDVDPATNPAFKEVSLELPASGWITDIGQATDHHDVVLPTAASGGSSSTYYPDYVYTSTSGPYTACFGGSYNYGDRAGLFFWVLSNSLTSVGSSIGARLSHRRL